MTNPIICAIDTTNIDAALQLAYELKPHVGAFKLGLEFFTANGPKGIRRITEEGMPVFLDLKFHDIPNTVAGAVRAAVALDVFMLTIHTSGGLAMMQAAKEAAVETAKRLGKKPPMVVGVTVLTSMDVKDINDVGVPDKEVATQVVRLAKLAKEAGLDGVVCSPHEIELIRGELGKDFVLVTPGIRPASSEGDDQKRVLTPREAIEKGSTYLVIGRPITQMPQPAEAAKAIVAQL